GSSAQAALLRAKAGSGFRFRPFAFPWEVRAAEFLVAFGSSGEMVPGEVVHSKPFRGGSFMNLKWKLMPLLALAIAAAATMLFGGSASATHPRPKGATPLRVSLAPTYKPCAPGEIGRAHV